MNRVNQMLWKLERCPCGLAVNFFNCSLASCIFSVRDDLTVAKHECHIRGLLPFAPDTSVSAEGRKRGDPVIRSLPTWHQVTMMRIVKTVVAKSFNWRRICGSWMVLHCPWMSSS